MADQTAPPPRVTLKLATSLDGRIATGSGESQWITGEPAREQVHRLRAEHDAVLVGSQTVIDDDPQLTVRLDGVEGRGPLRVVADARRRTPLSARVVQSAGETKTLIISSADPRKRSPRDVWDRLGTLMAECDPAEGGVGLEPTCILRQIDIALRHQLVWVMGETRARVLIEGGGVLAGSFLKADLVDRIEWFRAPIVLGAEGRAAIGEMGLERLADAPRFRRDDVRRIGDDLWETYTKIVPLSDLVSGLG